MKSRFSNMTTQQKISDAIKIAESLLAYNSKMLIEISKKDDFRYDSGSGLQVFNKINSCEVSAPVFTYKPKWVFTKALGYSDKTGIYLNLRKLSSLDSASLVGLLCHEWLHFGPKFSHGNNKPSEFKNTHSVNYFVSSNIETWL